MLWSGRRADVARSELKYHANLVVDLVALRQSLTLFERDPGTFRISASPSTELTFQRTLVFSITTLNLLMRLLLDLSL